MKITKSETVVYVVELSKQEAMIMKSIVQNPLCDDEQKELADFRRGVWEAIDELE